MKENYFSLKLFGIFSFKIDSTVHITLDPDLDPNLLNSWIWIRIQIQCIWIHNTAVEHAYVWNMLTSLCLKEICNKRIKVESVHLSLWKSAIFMVPKMVCSGGKIVSPLQTNIWLPFYHLTGQYDNTVK